MSHFPSKTAISASSPAVRQRSRGRQVASSSNSSRHKARGTDHQGLAGLPNTWSIERAPVSSGPYLGINAIREPFTVVILYRKPVPFSDPARPHRTCRVIHCHFHHCHSCSRKRRKKRNSTICPTYSDALGAAARVISSLRRKFKRQHGPKKLKSVHLCAVSNECVIECPCHIPVLITYPPITGPRVTEE